MSHHRGVITGYNTDIKHNDRVFHVQTEDKGVDNPTIESLIYMGGKIIDSRQYEYGWILREGYSEEAVQELVDIQHRKMLRDIRGGKYDPEGPPPFGAGIITERGFEELVLEFIQEQVEKEGIEVSVEEQPQPRPGELLVLEMSVVGDVLGKPVTGAGIVVSAVDEADRSMTLFEGETDRSGRVKAGFEVPRDFGGSHLVARARSSRGEDELRWEIAAP